MQVTITMAHVVGAVTILSFCCGGVAALTNWIHKERLEAKDDIIKAKDERLAAKDSEIDSLKRQLQTPSELVAHMQVIKAASEAETSRLRQQLAEASKSDQAKQRELQAQIDREDQDRRKIEALQRDLDMRLSEIGSLREDMRKLVQSRPLTPGMVAAAAAAASKDQAKRTQEDPVAKIFAAGFMQHLRRSKYDPPTGGPKGA